MREVLIGEREIANQGTQDQLPLEPSVTAQLWWFLPQHHSVPPADPPLLRAPVRGLQWRGRDIDPGHWCRTRSGPAATPPPRK